MTEYGPKGGGKTWTFQSENGQRNTAKTNDKVVSKAEKPPRGQNGKELQWKAKKNKATAETEGRQERFVSKPRAMWLRFTGSISLGSMMALLFCYFFGISAP